MQFLSGVIQRPIQQVGEIEADIMNILAEPCGCQSGAERDPIFIMWIKLQPTSQTYNHIVPLIPGSGI